MTAKFDAHTLDSRLRARLLLARAAPGDRLMLADSTLLAALDGSRALTPNERQALQQSPLTLRRLRHLSNAARPRAGAPDDTAWSGSHGMLRAAAGGAALERLRTDDAHWALHFVTEGRIWKVILQLAATAPFAPRLLRDQPLLRVLDGAGATVLEGRLDADGEVECDWPFALPPAPHFQLYGARFDVEPVAP